MKERVWEERSRKYITEYRLPPEVRERLSQVELRVLSELNQAAEITDDIYALQENDHFSKTANFYPPNVTKREIEEAAKQNPEILSPYTVVKRDSSERLFAVPYHEQYLEGLNRISYHLAQAANRADFDPVLQKYLQLRNHSLLHGNYEDSERFWLENPDTKIHIVIGPYDVYTDKFKNLKFSYQAWVGVKNEEETRDAKGFLDIFLTEWSKVTGREPPRIGVRVDHTTLVAGQAGKMDWTANCLPCQDDWREKYGSKFTVFWPSFEHKFDTMRLPSFKDFIHPDIRSGMRFELVKKATLRAFLGHEASHDLVSQPDTEERLEEYHAKIDELYCDLISLKIFSRINDVSITEREAAVAMNLVKGISDYRYSLYGDTSREDYLPGEAVILNWCLKNGSVDVVGGGRFNEGHPVLFWENILEVFANIEALCDRVEKLYKFGERGDAKAFLQEWARTEVYDQFLLTRVQAAEKEDGTQKANGQFSLSTNP